MRFLVLGKITTRNTLNVKFHTLFFHEATVTNPAIWLVLSGVRIFLSLTTVTVARVWCLCVEKVIDYKSGLREEKEKVYKLFTGYGWSVCWKSVISGLKLLPEACNVFTIRTSQLAKITYSYLACHEPFHCSISTKWMKWIQMMWNLKMRKKVRMKRK